MLNRKFILGAVIAATLGGASIPALARSNVDVIVNFAPPAPRYEQVVPRAGYVWAPGYWNYSRDRYVWVSGYWVRERPGHYWDAPRWVQSQRGWQFQQGRWNEGRRDWDRGHNGRGDRDHDGVPNYRDRDRDNDGVPNYRDRRPDNPRRN